MATTIPVQIPEALFQKLKRAADLTHRLVEDIAVTSLEAALPSASNLPPDIANELAAMHLFRCPFTSQTCSNARNELRKVR